MTLTDQLRRHIGQWVAVQGDSVIFSAGTAGELIEWLRENGLSADSCFRVPNGEKSVFWH
jgi:hypothetical protein